MSEVISQTGSSVAPTDPEQIYAVFQELADAGDVDALLDLYEDDCTVVPQPGLVASGREQVREALTGFLAALSDFRVQLQKSYRVGDLALVSGTWTATATLPDGSQMPVAGSDGVVLREQHDGTWRMVVDDANFIA